MMKLQKDGMGIPWMLDKEAARRVIRGYAFQKAALNHTRVIRTKDHWLQKVGLMDAHAGTFENTAALEREREQIVSTLLVQLEECYEDGWEDVYQLLVALKTAMLRNRARMTSMFDTAQDINRANIAAAENGIKWSRRVRDGSLVCISVIGAVGTGGLTVSLATGLGAAGQGAATYQDTGDVQKAAAEGILGLVPLGTAELKGAMKVAGSSKALIVSVNGLIDFGTETTKHMLTVDDARIEKALQQAALKTGSGLIEGMAVKKLSGFIGPRLRAGRRLVTDVHGRHGASSRLAPLLAKSAVTATKKGAVSGAKALWRVDPETAPTASDTPMRRDPVRDRANDYIHEVVMRRIRIDLPASNPDRAYA